MIPETDRAFEDSLIYILNVVSKRKRNTKVKAIDTVCLIVYGLSMEITMTDESVLHVGA